MNVQQLYRDTFGGKDPTILNPAHADVLISKIIDVDRHGESGYSKFDIACSIGEIISWIEIPPSKTLKVSTIKEVIFWIHENWDEGQNFREETFDLLALLENPRDILSFLEQKFVRSKEYRTYFRYCDEEIFLLDEMAFFKDVEALFPELTAEIVSWENLTKFKLEAFGRYTQYAIEVGDIEKAVKCFDLAADHFEKSGKNFRRFISIGFLKKLSFLGNRNKINGAFLAWKVFPKNLKNEFEKIVNNEINNEL